MTAAISMQDYFYQLVDGRHGRFLVNPNDTYIGSSLIAYGEWGDAEVRLFNRLLRAGDVVIEVGANIGSHTVPISKAVGPTGAVHAFEPQRLVHQLLNANLALNDCINVFPQRKAVGRSIGYVDICDVSPNHSMNYGNVTVGVVYDMDWRMENVPLISVDSLTLPRVDFLKIDAEGMDLQVLEGAVETLNAHRPVVFVETTSSNAAEMSAFFSAHGYTAYWYGTTLFDEQNFRGNSKNIWSEPGKDIVLVSADILALPTNMGWSVEGLLRFEEVTNWNSLPIDLNNYRSGLTIQRKP